ncbi:hypothetical protein ABKA04_002917 [Annulohypoxylon sp. FPYF3050]
MDHDYSTPNEPGEGSSSRVVSERQVRVRTLHLTAKWSYEKIANELGYSLQQVEDDCAGPLSREEEAHGPISPPTLPISYGRSNYHARVVREKIVRFIEEDLDHQSIAWERLRFFVEDVWNWSDALIVRAMQIEDDEMPLQWTYTSLTSELREERVAYARKCLDTWPHPDIWATSFLFTGVIFAHANRTSRDWISVHDCKDLAEFELLAQKGRG